MIPIKTPLRHLHGVYCLKQTLIRINTGGQRSKEGESLQIQILCRPLQRTRRRHREADVASYYGPRSQTYDPLYGNQRFLKPERPRPL